MFFLEILCGRLYYCTLFPSVDEIHFHQPILRLCHGTDLTGIENAAYYHQENVLKKVVCFTSAACSFSLSYKNSMFQIGDASSTRY